MTMGLCLLCLREEDEGGGREGELSGGVAGTRSAMAMSTSLRSLDASLRAIGSYGRFLSSTVCGQSCVLGRPVAAV